MHIPAFIKKDHSGEDDGNVSLVLAFGSPIIGFVGGSWLMAAHFNAALDAWIGRPVATPDGEVTYHVAEAGGEDGAWP